MISILNNDEYSVTHRKVQLGDPLSLVRCKVFNKNNLSRNVLYSRVSHKGYIGIMMVSTGVTFGHRNCNILFDMALDQTSSGKTF